MVIKTKDAAITIGEKTMTTRHTLLLFAGLVLGGCASGLQVSQDWNPEIDFSSYDTFALIDEETPRPSDQAFFEARVERALETVMEEKGLRLATSNPDLLVGWDAATEGKMSVSTYGSSYYGGSYRGRYGRSGWGGVGVSTTTTRVNEWDEGTLVIEIIDTNIDELIFTASAQAKLVENQSPEQRTERINQAVARMLREYPANN